MKTIKYTVEVPDYSEFNMDELGIFLDSTLAKLVEITISDGDLSKKLKKMSRLAVTCEVIVRAMEKLDPELLSQVEHELRIDKLFEDE